jgi:hypothetical protein
VVTVGEQAEAALARRQKTATLMKNFMADNLKNTEFSCILFGLLYIKFVTKTNIGRMIR